MECKAFIEIAALANDLFAMRFSVHNVAVNGVNSNVLVHIRRFLVEIAGRGKKIMLV